MKIQEDLTKYISSALSNNLPEKTQTKTRFHLLDAIVSILTGRLLPPGKRVLISLKIKVEWRRLHC